MLYEIYCLVGFHAFLCGIKWQTFQKNALSAVNPMKIQAASSATDVSAFLAVYMLTRSRKSSSDTHRRKKLIFLISDIFISLAFSLQDSPL